MKMKESTTFTVAQYMYMHVDMNEHKNIRCPIIRFLRLGFEYFL